MEPIEEYLRNLHRAGNAQEPPPSAQSDELTTSQSEPTDEPEKPPPNAGSVVDAPTAELPPVATPMTSRLRQKPTSALSSAVNKRENPRTDVLIAGIGAAVIIPLIIAGVFLIPRSAPPQQTAHGASQPAPQEPVPESVSPESVPPESVPHTGQPHTETAENAVVRLCNERAQAYSNGDVELLKSLTVAGSPARTAESFTDLDAFAGTDVTIDAVDISVESSNRTQATVHATVKVSTSRDPDALDVEDLTLTLKRDAGQWRVWEVVQTDAH